ncbi:hypothetical protein MIZ03_2096 [Rhodoferax lithotrophicus]|uniref:Uncharacterized protein n=1 Tax=Rhodoferax lithotrophicus TaxID=2798804 RepID=A0ABM7MLU9_9BURK|nr:hypothetical protein MIZ03_2096 [Rhodoferax sp. MIZ03]
MQTHPAAQCQAMPSPASQPASLWRSASLGGFLDPNVFAYPGEFGPDQEDLRGSEMGVCPPPNNLYEIGS